MSEADQEQPAEIIVNARQIRMGKFWRKYTRLIRAGVPLLRTLDVMAEEELDPGFKLIIDSLRESMVHGATLSQAMERHPSVFSVATTEMIRTAEKRGAWDEILQEISEGLLEGTFD
jgi:type IV pilus assembly protein PilC